MRIDDLYKRAKNKISRRKPARQLNKIILIVCEGEKTEIKYFKSLKEFLKLISVTIDIVPSSHPDPKQIIKYAIQKIRQFHEYDEIYCVFDKDLHTQKYINKVLETANKNNFKAIVSDPCFEFWILLHFTKIMPTLSTSQSPCKALQKCKTFKQYLPDYDKSNYDFDDIVANRLKTAIENANEINQINLPTRQTPYTEVVRLVENLQKLVKKN